jgi:hypothetical protein
MMPYVMRGRNESAVWHQQDYDLSKTWPWLDAWNRNHPSTPAGLFHLLMYSLGRVFHERPGLNRFISGGRIYQRNHVDLAFSVKLRMDDASPVVGVKIRVPHDEPFIEFMRRITSTITEARAEADTTAKKVFGRLRGLPAPVVSGAMRVLGVLDAWNLLPGAMIDSGYLHSTVYVANLGSVGIDRTVHHLCEYGTASFFGSLGTSKRAVVVGRDGKPTVRDTVQVTWSFDERINDGFYCARSLKIPQQIVEDPESRGLATL